jgi:Thiol-activated cytolysin
MSWNTKSSTKTASSMIALSCGLTCLGGFGFVLAGTSAIAQTAAEPAAPAMRQMIRRAPMMRAPTQTATPAPELAPPSSQLGSSAMAGATSNSAISIMSRAIGIKAELLEATTMTDFIAKLPEQQQKRPDRLVGLSGVESTNETAQDGGRPRNYGVTRQRLSLSQTPEEIVTFGPVAGFWLGSILEEQGLRGGLGSQREVPVPSNNRAPYLVSINSLAIPNSYREITNPSMSSVNSAIGSMIQAAGNVEVGTSMSMKMVDNYSANQAALSLNLDVSYLSARVKAALEANSSASRQAITLSFVQNAFTVAMDTQGRSRGPAFFNDTFTLDQAKDLVNQGRLGVTSATLPQMNPPNYIKSITYGRAVLINVVSNMDRSELKTLLNGSYDSGVFKANINSNQSSARQNERFELQVTTFGGPGNALSNLVVPISNRTELINALNTYLRAPAPLTTMVPISYAAYSLRDDRLATIQRTTEYTLTQYAPEPIGRKIKLDIRFTVGGDDGVGDNTNELWGNIRINGQLVSQIERIASEGNKREPGQSLAMTKVNTPNDPITIEWYFGDPDPVVEVDMWDSDGSSGDDWLYRKRFSLPMSGLADSETSQFIDSQYSVDQSGTSSITIDMTKLSDL